MSQDKPQTVICRYKIKPGTEEMIKLLQKHWPTLHAAGLTTNDKPLIYRSIASGKRPQHLRRDLLVEERPVGRGRARDPGDHGRLGAHGRDLRGHGLPALRAPRHREMSSRSDAETRLADVDSVFKALAHASRRHILLVLHFRGGEMTAGEIASRFGCSWPTTTRHLRVLQDAGLVRVEKRGRERIYRVDRERLDDVAGGWLRVLVAPGG
jgi:DNA-binding transcriptional ArsR family regulator